MVVGSDGTRRKALQASGPRHLHPRPPGRALGVRAQPRVASAHAVRSSPRQDGRRLMLPIQRWSGQAAGRSRAVAYQGMVWAVATSDDESGDVQAQARRCLELVDQSLAAAGTDKTRLLSAQVFLSEDRKSTRLNSSHVKISYAVF